MRSCFRTFTLATAAAAITTFTTISTVLAFGGDSDVGGGLVDPGTDPRGKIRSTVTMIVVAVLDFLALVALIVVIIAGIRIITSQGDESAVTSGRKTIIYALIGLLVVLLARVIIALVTVWLKGQLN